MPAITVTPLAFESLGVRSMCTQVKTKDVTILLDAGVALGPRFRLMPHPKEYRARGEARKRIEEAAKSAEVVTVSHYHNDHHTPNYVEPVYLGSSPESCEHIYRDKIVLAKDSRRKINTAQRRRGWMFKQHVEKIASKFEIADGRTFEYGRTKVRFSPPVPHGEEDSGLGWVLLCIIERSKEKFLFAPDVQGPVVPDTAKLILNEEPDLVIMGGPPTYLQGFRIGEGFFQTALLHMQQIAEKVPELVVDHHLLRDEGWYKFMQPVRESAVKAGHRLIAASELLPSDADPLEGKRKKLYEDEKPSKEFLKWAKLPQDKRSMTPPPV